MKCYFLHSACENCFRRSRFLLIGWGFLVGVASSVLLIPPVVQAGSPQVIWNMPYSPPSLGSLVVATVRTGPADDYWGIDRDNGIYIAGSGSNSSSYVMKIDPSTQSVEWQKNYDQSYGGMITANWSYDEFGSKTLTVKAYNGTILDLDPTNGSVQQAWSAPFTDYQNFIAPSPGTWTSPGQPDSIISTAAPNGVLLNIDKQTGMQWTQSGEYGPLTDGVAYTRGPDDSERLLAVTSWGKVVCFDPSPTGGILWQTTSGVSNLSAVTIDRMQDGLFGLNSSYAYAVGQLGGMAKINLATGRLVSTTTVAPGTNLYDIVSWGNATAASNNLYAAGQGGQLIEVSASTGQPVWSTCITSGGQTVTSLAPSVDGYLYAVGGNQLIKVNPGNPHWTGNNSYWKGTAWEGGSPQNGDWVWPAPVFCTRGYESVG